MTRRLIGQVHLWAGLSLCVPLVALGLTGSVLVFEDELRATFGPAARHQAAVGTARPANEIVAAARAVVPAGFIPLAYTAPDTTGQLASVRMAPQRRDAPGADVVRINIDPVSLEAFPEPQNSWLRQIFYLHSTLLMKNREGRQLAGWLGVAMLIMGASGLVNWWPRRGQWPGAFFVSRHGRGFRLYREVHGAAGIWGLAVFLIVSFAGVYLAFPEAVRSAVDLVLPARDLRANANALKVVPAAGEKPGGIDEAITLAQSQFPGAGPSFAFLPTRPNQPYRIGLLRPDQARRAPAITVFVDPWAHRVIETFDPRQFSLGERILAWQHSVHAGQGLGWAWKILVFLCGLLPLLFSLSGAAMRWLKRNQRKSQRAAADLIPNQVETARRAGG
jgi:uncharacterized iron-regulated membrane protein